MRGKYRGKRIDNGEWIEGWYAHQEATGQHFIVVELKLDSARSYFSQNAVDPKTVGQHTGWRDDVDQEVYQGDNVQNLITGDIYEVVWDVAAARFVFEQEDDGCDWHDFYELDERYGSGWMRKIGNRWDTPEGRTET